MSNKSKINPYNQKQPNFLSMGPNYDLNELIAIQKAAIFPRNARLATIV